MDAARSVTANFTLNTYTLSVNKTGTGSGTVTSVPAGIACGADLLRGLRLQHVRDADGGCGHRLDLHRLERRGLHGHGHLHGDDGRRQERDGELHAQHLYAKRQQDGHRFGHGDERSGGHRLRRHLLAAYDYNTSVTLTAAAATGSTFTGWSGAGCSGTGACTVTMDAAKNVTANFTLKTYVYLPLVTK